MAAQVLDTYELIEDILLRLPLRQLLLAQRVNKKFHGVINDSRKVKRALFFESSSDIRAKFRFENTDRRPRYNHDFRWTHEGEDTKAVILLRNPFNEIVTSINPCKVQTEHYSGKLVLNRRLRQEPQSYRLGFLGMLDTEIEETVSPSLTRMLTSHPPTSEMVSIFSRKMSVVSPIYPRLVNRDGLRYGDLCTFLDEERQKGAYSNSLAVSGSYQWCSAPQTVDVLTGWEMLQLLSLSSVERTKVLNMSEYVFDDRDECGPGCGSPTAACSSC